MRLKLLSLILLLFFFISANAQLPASSFSFSCVQRDTISGRGLNCVTLSAKIPNIKSLTDAYVVNRISQPQGCFRQYVSPASPGTILALNDDDTYSNELPLPLISRFMYLLHGLSG